MIKPRADIRQMPIKITVYGGGRILEESTMGLAEVMILMNLYLKHGHSGYKAEELSFNFHPAKFI